MLSLILPYWDRQDAADRALRRLSEYYSGTSLEVVVVDDGNYKEFVAPDVRLNIKIVRLPKKSTPKSPVTCWNEGVRQASGDIIAISCIEVLHQGAIMFEMESHLVGIGKNGYILAAAYCPDERIWHTHSSVPVPQCPPGTGLAFLGMMHRKLYERAGGFDEEYRDGAGYEDRDFIHRMTKAGAEFVIRDDLIVLHPKKGATIRWKPEAFSRNKQLFEQKWIN